MKIWLLISILICVGCSENLFDEIADKDTNEALFFQAKLEINARDYAAAIALLDSLDPAFISARSRAPVYASAYAGRCGLEFLTLLNTMQNVGSATIFGTLMGSFPGALASNVQDCIAAESILEAIGDESARVGDENLLMAFNGLAKIGTILSSLADTDDDATADATFDQCNTTSFPEAMVRELGASLAVTILSLSAIGTSYIDGALTDVNALCALHPDLAVFCNTTDPATFTAQQVRFLRYAIGSSDVGINSCAGNDFTTCAAIHEPIGPPDCF